MAFDDDGQLPTSLAGSLTQSTDWEIRTAHAEAMALQALQPGSAVKLEDKNDLRRGFSKFQGVSGLTTPGSAASNPASALAFLILLNSGRCNQQRN